MWRRTVRCILGSVLTLCFCVAAPAQVPLAQHVVLVIEENRSFSSVYPLGMPWLVKEGDDYGYAVNYYSDVAGSLLDYLWLSSGSSEYSFGCNGNDCSSPITDENIFRVLNEGSISWKVYAQNYLNAGGQVTAPDLARGSYYYRRHNAATWYSDILSNVLGSQGGVVDFEQFAVDAAKGSLPRYSIIVPDGMNDSHDGTMSAASSFLRYNLGPLLSRPDFSAGGSALLIVTFDNGDYDRQGQVYTAVMGPNVRSHFVSGIYYQHQNVLRTVLDSLGVNTYPGASANASDMSDFFLPDAGSVVINSPANQSIQGTTVTVNASASELGSKIDHLEIWDNGAKLGNVFGTSVNEQLTQSVGAHKLTIQDIGPAPNYAVLHKAAASYQVSGRSGVVMNTPTGNSSQAMLFPVDAYAVELAGNIDHLEVWADGAKLGDSPKGSTIHQWYSLAPGPHLLTIVDVSTVNFLVLHQTTVPITVSADNNVYVNAPAGGLLRGKTVLVNAYAYEQSNSNTLVDHLEVWDNGVKLGNSPIPYGGTSLFINQTYSLKSGPHELTVQDISTGYQVIHRTTVNVTVP